MTFKNKTLGQKLAVSSLLVIPVALSLELAATEAQEKAAGTADARASLIDVGQSLASGQELLPPNAKPGECYARVFVPPTFESIEEQVIRAPETEKISVIPAKFEEKTEEVEVEAASFKLELVPAVFEEVEKQVEVAPAHFEFKVVPAVYETVEEKVLDKPATTVWKKGRGPVEKVDNGTGEIMCLVEVPAKYKTIKKQVLKSPERIEKIEVPAKFKTVKTKVMKTPPTTKRVEIPAKTKKVTKTVMVAPAQEQVEKNPPEFQTVTKTKLAKAGRMDWQAVLCETNTTPGKIRQIQQALNDAGYNAGVADGRYGKQTTTAIKQFQADKGIAQGGITIETLNKLGVDA